MQKSFRVSAKQLGELNLPNADPQIFWLKYQSGFRTPFSIFPGIFNTLDGYQKNVTRQNRGRLGNWPSWLPPEVEDQVECPHWSKFQWVDPVTGITLSGQMDECYELIDGTLLVNDNKLALKTDGQDALLPMYTAQLNGYAKIAENVGMGKVTMLQLTYHEPVVDIADTEELCRIMDGDGYLLKFRPAVISIERDDELIDRLLAKAKAIMEMEEMPPLGAYQRVSKDMEIIHTMARLLNPNRKADAERAAAAAAAAARATHNSLRQCGDSVGTCGDSVGTCGDSVGTCGTATTGEAQEEPHPSQTSASR